MDNRGLLEQDQNLLVDVDHLSDAEVKYLVRRIGVQRVRALAEQASWDEQRERSERLCPNDTHTSEWYAGYNCRRCGKAG